MIGLWRTHRSGYQQRIERLSQPTYTAAFDPILWSGGTLSRAQLSLEPRGKEVQMGRISLFESVCHAVGGMGWFCAAISTGVLVERRAIASIGV